MVQFYSDDDVSKLQTLTEDSDLVVIDLNMEPSHGRELAAWIRRRKATRHLPLVFIEGDPAKTTRVRQLLPDAVYTGWKDILGAIDLALVTPLADPVVPGAMEGYSGTPLPKKLGIRSGSSTPPQA